MKVTKPRQKQTSGFLLMESLIATGIFAISITGLATAVYQTTELHQVIQRESWVQKQLSNAFYEFTRTPQILADFEKGATYELGEFGAQAVVFVEKSALSSEEAIPLENLYDLKISVIWYENDKKLTRDLSTTHYFPLYQ
ncbi:hypothetical protein OAB00_02605 [Akkermansiaceae bacterium]|nr:hypothetical protein [Akkermansiaceae bacterium]